MAGRFTSIGEGLGSLIGYFVIIISVFFLPSALVYIKTNYPKSKITEAAKITDDKNVVTYEAEIGKDGKSYDVLFDASGKTLLTHPILNESSSIALNSYATGNYYLHVLSDGKTLHTFKIIKHQ